MPVSLSGLSPTTALATDYRFSRKQRMSCNADFQALQQSEERERIHLRYQSFHLSARIRADEQCARLGMRISKRHIDRAVDRSRLRRQVREVFRAQNGRMGNCDLIFYSNPSLASSPRVELRQQLGAALQQVKQQCQQRQLAQ